jgi:hypothetical protein
MPRGLRRSRRRFRRGFAFNSLTLGAGAAADRRVVEANVACAARFAAGAEAIAAGLNHGLAGLVTTRAADAAAVFGVFALANTDGEVALAAGDSVARAAAAAKTVGQHAAEVLQRAAGDFIIAAAMDLAAVRGLFELDRAARQHTPIRRLRLADLTWLNAWNRTGKRCDRRRTTFQ